MPTRAIRTATTICENTEAEIVTKTSEMLEEAFRLNDVCIDDIISITFSATEDVTACYPAVAARKLGVLNAGLLCLSELEVKDSLRLCVRSLILVESEKKQKEIQHVYLHGAKVLRPDLAGKCETKMTAIAIDGPSGSGKSTVAKIIAQKLGFIYVDTGAMYRAVAYYCLQNGISLHDTKEVVNALQKIDITIEKQGDVQAVFLNGENVTDFLRTQDVAEGASLVAVISEVRERLVSLQREIAKKENVIMDGRDIGSVVLPNASLKIYLDGSAEERTRRRIAELTKNGVCCDEKTVCDEIVKRDLRDTTREISPLKKADDSVTVFSDGMSIDEVVAEIIKYIV